MKLISRYNRFILPPLILLFTLSIIVSYFLIRNVLQNELDEMLRRTKNRIEIYIKTYDQIPPINTFNDQIVQFEKTAAPIKDKGISSSTQFIPEQNKYHISRKIVFEATIHRQLYMVTISEPLEGTKHLTILILKIAVVTILVILLILFLINRFVLSNLWRPFYDSLNAMKSFKISNPKSLTFPRTDTNEFILMTEHFKTVTDNAIKDYSILKEFSENASHESQTPLAIIRSKLDLLLQQETLTEKQSELMQSAYTAVTKLSKLNRSLLLLAKIDNRQFQQNSEIDLTQKLKEKILQFHELWQNNRITFSSELNNTAIQANTELIDILLNNLLSNATWHNIPDGQIQITLHEKKMEIANTGKAEALDENRVFKRFYKASPKNESNGLGLSIVKQISIVSGIDSFYLYSDGWHRFIFTW